MFLSLQRCAGLAASLEKMESKVCIPKTSWFVELFDACEILRRAPKSAHTAYPGYGQDAHVGEETGRRCKICYR
jgi:hypothetical protein